MSEVRRNPPSATGSVPRLFPSGELVLRPTGVARLREMARIPTCSRSARQRRVAEDREVLLKLRERGIDLGGRFGLCAAAIEAEREGVNGHYGICYADGLIRIRLRHARTGKLLKESSLVDTLCHELAHLRHMDHGPRFRRLYLRILGLARRLGYYRPGPERLGPRQQRLFGAGSCGTGLRG